MADQRDLWGFPIEWRAGFEEDIAWRTALIVSRDGTEQRIGQRVKPRITYSFACTLANDSFRAALNRVAEGQGREFLIPYPREGVALTVDAPVGSTVQTVAEVPSWLTGASQAALVPPGLSTAELVDVAAAGGSTVLLDTPLIHAAPAGSKLMQLRSGQFSGGVTLRAITNTVATAGVEFDADPIATPLATYPAAPLTYGGRELWDTAPNWAGGVQHEFQQEHIDLDLDRGPVDAFFPVRYTGRSVQMQYLLRTPDQIDALLGLFYRCRGRQKTFYTPLWASELRPNGNILPGATVRFRGRELFDAYADSIMYRKLAFKLPSGLLYRDVSGMAISGDDTVVTVSEALPGITLAELRWCGWLARCRFASDRLSLQWLTDGAAQATITIMTLEDS